MLWPSLIPVLLLVSLFLVSQLASYQKKCCWEAGLEGSWSTKGWKTTSSFWTYPDISAVRDPWYKKNLSRRIFFFCCNWSHNIWNQTSVQPAWPLPASETGTYFTNNCFMWKALQQHYTARAQRSPCNSQLQFGFEQASDTTVISSNCHSNYWSEDNGGHFRITKKKVSDGMESPRTSPPAADTHHTYIRRLFQQREDKAA